jgi:hypothetical protein
MDRENMVQIHVVILFGHKKNEIVLFATTWMALASITLSEINQAHKTSTA